MADPVVTFSASNHVGIITLNRPPANSYEMGSLGELEEAIEEAEAHPEVGVVILKSASEKFFCAGADIKELDLGEGPAAAPLEGAFVVLRYVAEARKVCIAAVNGIALGAGTELALACDFRIAGDTAQFGLPEVKLGLLPGAGGSQWMPRTVGASRAKWMMMTGDFIDAQTALQWGLVN